METTNHLRAQQIQRFQFWMDFSPECFSTVSFHFGMDIDGDLGHHKSAKINFSMFCERACKVGSRSNYNFLSHLPFFIVQVVCKNYYLYQIFRVN